MTGRTVRNTVGQGQVKQVSSRSLGEQGRVKLSIERAGASSKSVCMYIHTTPTQGARWRTDANSPGWNRRIAGRQGWGVMCLDRLPELNQSASPDWGPTWANVLPLFRADRDSLGALVRPQQTETHTSAWIVHSMGRDESSPSPAARRVGWQAVHLLESPVGSQPFSLKGKAEVLVVRCSVVDRRFERRVRRYLSCTL